MREITHTFTIERSSWIRGEGAKARLLRTKDQKRCCMGFFLKSLGVEDDSLRAEKTVAQLLLKETHDGEDFKTISILEKQSWLFSSPGADSEAAIHLMLTNDKPYLDDHRREIDISMAFLAQGIRVWFDN